MDRRAYVWWSRQVHNLHQAMLCVANLALVSPAAICVIPHLHVCDRLVLHEETLHHCAECSSFT